MNGAIVFLVAAFLVGCVGILGSKVRKSVAVPCCLLWGLALLMVGYWIAPLKSGDPFRAELRSAMVYDGNGPISLFMVGYSSKYGQTASPVFYLSYIQIVNLQEVASTIVNYSMSVSDSGSGPWDNLVPISLMSSNLFALGMTHGGNGILSVPQGIFRLDTPMKLEDMKRVVLLNPHPKIEAEMMKPVQPHHTISGWAAFETKRHYGPITRKYYKITLRDSANVSFASTWGPPRGHHDDTEADARVGLIDKIGTLMDISNFHIKYYSDP